MFENLVHQEASKVLAYDIKNNILPRAILFSGEENSGKLTAAFEVSRILNCKGDNKSRRFDCNCPSCLHQKALTSINMMLLGPRDCFLEIAAAKESFLRILSNSEEHLDAARYFFLRSIRKLTLRFNDILWTGDSKVSKIGALLEEINDNLEILDFPHELPAIDEVQKVCEELETLCKKLEEDYLYSSIPVNQIRNMEEWCAVKADSGRKVIIIENADRMLPNVRNALLKILEEPPENCLFILLTSKRNAVMETILSRVRTYHFKPRTIQQQAEVMGRVFHSSESIQSLAEKNLSVNDYLLTYLPVSPADITAQANVFYDAVKNRSIPDISTIVKKCGNFSPRVELKIFLNAIAQRQKSLHYSQAGCEFCSKNLSLLKECWDNIMTYNQSPAGAMEILLRDMSVLNVTMQGVMKNS